jgi:hypothetical protein
MDGKLMQVKYNQDKYFIDVAHILGTQSAKATG